MTTAVACIDLFGIVGSEAHDELRAAVLAGPLAVDSSTGATVVLRHRDVEALARDRRLKGSVWRCAT